MWQGCFAYLLTAASAVVLPPGAAQHAGSHNAAKAPPPQNLTMALANASRGRGLMPPQAGRIYDVDASPDPRKAWPCLEVRKSSISGAGKGLFARCGLRNSTLLGEYRGMRFFMGQVGANKRLQSDWDYIWKVPRCLAPKNKLQVITRNDKNASHNCSSRNSFVYVDAKPMDSETANPMRFVNGVFGPQPSSATFLSAARTGKAPGDVEHANVEAFFADDRVWYHTMRDIAVGEELFVDYGKGYWRPPAGTRAAQDSAYDQDVTGMVADWGNFVGDDF